MRTETILTKGWKFSDEMTEGGELFGCPEDTMKEVSVPHDWAAGRPFKPDMKYGCEQGFFDRAGLGWYRSHLKLEGRKENFRYYVVFDGVYENATVWFNEKILGSHHYGYSGFRFEVTEQIREGENLLAVQVDNTNSRPDRWYSGAGIYRRVKLLMIPVCHMEEEELLLQAQVKAGTTGLVTAVVPVSGDGAASLRVSMDLFQEGVLAGRTEAVVENHQAKLCLEIPQAALWDAENPKLYEAVFQLADEKQVDTVTRKIGFRTVEWDAERGMLINGNAVKMKGVCLHHDAGCLGAAATKATWARRLELMKSMGCNAVRTSHNIPDEILMDLCDEMGFYVLEEFTDKWKDGSYGRFFEEDWQADLDYMVRRDRHRPSVMIWSVGNEVDRQGSRFMLDILHMLVQEVKRLDSSRPVTCALSPHFSDDDGKEWMAIPDRLAAIVRVAAEVDLLALNYQEQWYEKLHELLPGKLIIGSEIYMFFRGQEIQYMNYSMENPWMDVEKHAFVTGGFVWAGIDYLGESMGYPAKGWGGCLVKSNLVRKPISYLWESYWSDKPMVYFSVQDYTLSDDLTREHWSCPRLAPHWNFEQYGRTVIPYMIFSNCEEVRVLLNDVRYYVKNPQDCESRIITGYLPYVPGHVKVIGLNQGNEVCSYEINTSGPALRLSIEPEAEIIRADPEAVTYIHVSALDCKGIICFKDNAQIHIQLQGPAALAGVDNGDLMDTNSFQTNRVRLHWGQAVLALRPTGEPGRIRVLVSVDGFTAAQTIITAQ